MTAAAGNPDTEPAFIEVGEGNTVRRIAVRARAGASPGLIWLGGFFLRGIFVLPVIHDLANGRIGIGRNLDQIHAGIHGHLHSGGCLDRAVVRAVLIDQLNLGVADFIIGARPVFGGGGRGSIGTANGDFSKVVKGRR